MSRANTLVGFNLDKDIELWKKEWWGMPEYSTEDLGSFRSMLVHFESPEDVVSFGDLIGQKITTKTRSLYYPYPEAEIRQDRSKRYVTREPVNPLYPVYVISKGRWEPRMTIKALEKMEVPFSVVVEPQEYGEYAAVVDPSKILKLPFSNLGQGSIPARNWVWEHAVSVGAKRHWILDDNIARFDRLNHNYKHLAGSGAIFRAAEDFVDRYENVALAGFQYDYFVPSKDALPPFALNTRIYSCILIKNNLKHRWRGRYNEDTDLSLRVLKDGLCTVLFYTFLQEKTPTMEMTGGNTDELYKEDGRKKMAESLVEQHPDLVTLAWKWGRWQHHVDYRGFRHNKLARKKGIAVSNGTNDYGMTLEADPNYKGGFRHGDLGKLVQKKRRGERSGSE